MIILYTGAEFELSSHNGRYDYAVRRRLIQRESACDRQFIAAYVILLYGADYYGICNNNSL